MPEIILITLAKNLFRILKNEVRNQKRSLKGDVHLLKMPLPLILIFTILGVYDKFEIE